MNKITKGIAALGLFIVTGTQAQAELISNGGFDDNVSCSLSNWQAFGLVNTGGSTGSCVAELEVNDEFPTYEAELWQSVNFVSNTDYVLSVDFEVDTTLNDAVFDDFFSISLLNDDVGFLELFSFNITGADSFSTDLAINSDDLSSFANQDWRISLFLYDDISLDDNSSFVSFSSISLTEVTTAVPEPSSIAIFALGLAGLMTRRKQANELVRKSIKK